MKIDVNSGAADLPRLLVAYSPRGIAACPWGACIRLAALWLVLFLFPTFSFSQNLIANGGFEDANICTEYQVPCSPAAWLITFNSGEGKSPSAKEGRRALSLLYDNIYMNRGNRSFPYTRLLCALLPGKEYDLSLWLNTGGFDFTQLEVVLTWEDPTSTVAVIGKITPDIIFTTSDIVSRDSHDWIQLKKKFTINKKKDFLLVGNVFLPEEYTHSQQQYAKKHKGFITYWLDDLRLFATDSALNACPLYEGNRTTLYAEHRRHSRGLYLDTLISPAEPLPGATLTPAPSDITPITTTADTLLLPGFLFASNSSKINPNYNHVLDSLIDEIRNKKPAKLDISGHTDNTGPEELNQSLSLHRAQTIKKYIVEKLPAFESGITAEGYGSTRPITPNTSAAGKAKNRRVQIVLTY